MEGMNAYARPFIEPLEFRDDSGAVIDYGNRWDILEGPPDDTYSVLHHPERFAPLHTVATAVVEYLIGNHGVDVDEGYQVLAGHLHTPGPEYVTRAVRLTPRTAYGAPITVVWTTDPAIRIYAGALFDTVYPSCSCDACDERWNECADELEETTFAIVAGGLAEHISGPKRPTLRFEPGMGFVQGMGHTVSYRLRSRDGKSVESGRTRAERVPDGILASARTTLHAVHSANPTHDWTPWRAT